MTEHQSHPLSDGLSCGSRLWLNDPGVLSVTHDSSIPILHPSDFMNLRSFLALSVLITTAAFAADAPKPPHIPGESIAKKKELLFSDDFQGTTPDKRWHRVVDTFAVEKGMLKGTQTREKTIPAAVNQRCRPLSSQLDGMDWPAENRRSVTSPSAVLPNLRTREVITGRPRRAVQSLHLQVGSGTGRTSGGWRRRREATWPGFNEEEPSRVRPPDELRSQARRGRPDTRNIATAG